MLSRCCVALLLVAGSAPISAQDGSESVSSRTPASAQRFLIATPPLQLYNVETTPIGDNRVSLRNDQYTVLSVTSDDTCVTTYQLEPTPGGQPIAAPISTLKIDWSQVEDIDSGDWRGAALIVSAPKIVRGGLNIAFSVSATRDRVFAAAQYLKDKCDKKADTGF